ncbi:LOW QUALITY PROTEIN: hypothetical protein PHMEG_00032329 [Phytophthora megakarya]|uniref:PiggyBac transposable element-derived protein domain-containing protein n=1 Tax=Phytophthora megakarya TaxID=4795 RepID=A0A225UVS3_9STRA|nr:LOW QUALITY PROTEIN: hypothetical protein PHMEG_00032329 [Phytophthora megakarya]
MSKPDVTEPTPIQGREDNSAEESKEDSDVNVTIFDTNPPIATAVVGADILQAGTTYISRLEAIRGITLLQEERTKRVCRNKGLMGLFALCFTRKLRVTLGKNLRLQENGIPAIGLCELNAYFGLDIATSLCPLNHLRDYWSTNEFYGHPLFMLTMRRDLFLCIRSALTLHPMDTVPEEVKLCDPLWHRRSILNNILERFLSLRATWSIRTKARYAARTFIPLKSDKYAVRFYALVDWKTLYIHGLFDNGSGNTTVGAFGTLDCNFP